MHKHFVRHENYFSLSSEVNRIDKLPVGNYTVRQNQLTLEYFLELVDDFTFPTRVYGDYSEYADRILKTYIDRGKNTGVLLTGEKGSGKTLTSKLLSVKARELGIPTLLINEPHHGENFNQFLQDINQKCIIIFDEFEKVYEWESQTSLLTLLDGVFPSSKLFILTTNEFTGIDRHLVNRPGRIFYKIEFKQVTSELITEFCNDNLKDTAETSEILKLAMIVSKFNIDMLSSLVEEMNRYGESAFKAAELLNISVGDSDEYDITLEVNGKNVTSFEPSYLHTNPLTMQSIRVYDYVTEDGNIYHIFERDSLKSMNGNTGTFIFETTTPATKKGAKPLIARLVVKRKDPFNFSLSNPYYSGVFN